MSQILFAIFGIHQLFSTKNELKNGFFIERPAVGKGKKDINILAQWEEDGTDYINDLQISVNEREYTKEEWEQKVLEAERYIDKYYLGNNSSSDNVNSKLNLMEQIPDSNIKISWETDNKGRIKRDGSINNETIDESGEIVTITALLSNHEYKEEYQLSLHIIPAVYTKQEMIKKNIEEEVKKQDERLRTRNILELPKIIKDKPIKYSEKYKDSSNKIILVVLFLLIISWFALDKELINLNELRKKQILMDYPEFIYKIVLLLGAGMTMKGAWEKICMEYLEMKKEQGSERYVYEEMLRANRELQNGILETKVYESFGKRIQLLPYLKFSSLVVQNLRKGSSCLFDLLEYESVQALHERKEIAKRLGEEASTKLLLPMGILLFIVLTIIMVPAFQSI